MVYYPESSAPWIFADVANQCPVCLGYRVKPMAIGDFPCKCDKKYYAGVDVAKGNSITIYQCVTCGEQFYSKPDIYPFCKKKEDEQNKLSTN